MRCLFRFLSFWPLSVLHAVGGVMGWLTWALSPSYRAHFRANVAQAGLPFAQARPAIAETGRFVAELPKLWLRPRTQSCLGNVQVEGRGHAEQAFAQGRGVIFVGAHCGSFEFGSHALAELYGPITAIYRPARKPWLARLERIARDRDQLTLAPAGLSGIRQMYKSLKANQAVALLADQAPPEGLGLWAPFFGRPAYTVTLPARMALQTGAVLLPVNCERLPHGRGYRLKIWPPVAGLADCAKSESEDGQGGLLQAVTLVNQAIEAMVLSQPGQYLWAYARYKTPRKEAA